MTEAALPLPEAETYVLTVPDLTDEFAFHAREEWAAVMPGKVLLILGGGARIEPLSHLDALFTEAKGALPPDMAVRWTIRCDGPLLRSGRGWTEFKGIGPSPAEALRALIADLREK